MLSVLDSVLNMFDSAFQMTVGNENVEPAVQVEIEKETPETESQQAGAADSRTRRLIDKEAITLVMIEGKHLVGEVRDQNAWEIPIDHSPPHPHPFRHARCHLR